MITISETDHRFTIAPSTIAGAGLGLFASELIRAGDYLEIIGVCVDVGDICHVCTHYANRYKFANEPEVSFRNAIIPMGYAALVNHADTPERQNVAITYIPAEHPRRNPACPNVVYLAVRDIQEGEELLTNYQRKDIDAKVESTDLRQWKHLLSKNFYGLIDLLDAKDRKSIHLPNKTMEF